MLIKAELITVLQPTSVGTGSNKTNTKPNTAMWTLQEYFNVHGACGCNTMFTNFAYGKLQTTLMEIATFKRKQDFMKTI